MQSTSLETPTSPAPPVAVGILEDHPLMRDTLAETLTRAGHSVSVKAGELDDFLQALGSGAPQVAIVDLRLERADGTCSAAELEALQAVHACYPEVRLLVVSARHDQSTVRRCLQLGASGFLPKSSVDGVSLVRAVESLGRGERLVPADFLEVGPAGASSPPSLLSRLTPREREVLAYVARGDDNLKIAAQLDITERTVKAHMSNLYRKLGPENRAQLALLARQLGVRPPEP